MSWQNVVLTLILRWRIKRNAKGEPDVAKARALAARTAMKPRIPPGWRIRQVSSPRAGEWVERVDDASELRRTILYLHGGGYYFCSQETHRSITLALAIGAEARVFVPDYRLAPEHRFPAAIEDAVAAYRDLLSNGTPAARLVIAGDSAGGGLALATLLSLRDASDPLPAAAVLFSPWTDLAATGASLRTNDKRDPMFSGETVAQTARIYLGETPPINPLASPLYAELKGLPPLFIQASDSEVLLDDSSRLAEKATCAGIAVSFRAWHKLPHVWQFFTPFLPEARQALAETADFIKRAVP
ncbi:MAG TPA: alpha/beta hydrolase [Stellaceae bacterium]|nr:alpha/beta hydrolase [Stellaceae bacterium]